MNGLTKAKIWSREFVEKNGVPWFNWNPFIGCKNEKCHLHPVHKGKCWAASMAWRMAEQWADNECNYQKKNDNSWLPDSVYHWNKLSFLNFEPVFLDYIFNKKFPTKPSNILVSWMSDISTVRGEWVQRVIDRITDDSLMRVRQGLKAHQFFFLTKNPEVYRDFKWPGNCWLGFTATTQAEFDARVLSIHEGFTTTTKEGRSLLNAKYFTMLEPLRDVIKMRNKKIATGRAVFPMNWLRWVVVGGGDTPMNPEWVREIRDACQNAGVPFHYKSSGDWVVGKKNSNESAIFKVIDGTWYYRNGKKLRTNILDGVKHLQGPGGIK